MFAVVVLVQNAAEEINVRLEKHIYFHFLECYNLVHLLALHEYFIVNKSSSYTYRHSAVLRAHWSSRSHVIQAPPLIGPSSQDELCCSSLKPSHGLVAWK